MNLKERKKIISISRAVDKLYNMAENFEDVCCNDICFDVKYYARILNYREKLYKYISKIEKYTDDLLGNA